MAEPIGLASGILTLSLFAFQSSITLYETIKSFQSHPKRVRDLLQELEALVEVLTSLTEICEVNTDLRLTPLELPLKQCGNACKDFEKELQKCSSRSSSSRTSFRDWAKLRYMGDDIDGFRNLLAGYKATIGIALADANLRKSTLTAESLETYKKLLGEATEDLQTRLETIDEKLDALVGQAVKDNDNHPDVTELKQIEDERLSTQKCLQICEQLSRHIEQLQLGADGLQPSSIRDAEALPVDSDSFSERTTKEGLEACKKSIFQTTQRLERHMKELTDRLITKSRGSMTSEDDFADLARLQDQWAAARQCIEICSKAEDHLRANVSNIENEATGDAFQVMVSTNGKILHGKNRGLGWRTRQVGGYVSNDALLQLSRDMSATMLKDMRRGGGGDGDTVPTPTAAAASTVPDDDITNSSAASEFNERHGRGVRLTPKSSPTSRG